MNGMPIGRDVRVGNRQDDGGDPKKRSDGDVKANLSGLVTVMGFDRNDVLFRSDSVGAVQWRDSHGDIVAILIRLKPDIWGFSMRSDDDFEQILEKYGSEDLHQDVL